MDDGRGAAGGRPDVVFREAQSMFGARMLLQERYDAPPPMSDTFVATFRDRYAPALAGTGLRLVGFWQASAVAGELGRYLALWEADDGPHLTRVLVALDSPTDGVPRLQAARDELSLTVRDREGWVLLGLPGSLSLAEIAAHGIGTTCILREDVTLLPNQYDLYNKALRTNYLRLLHGSGIELIGVYRPQLLTVSATVLWALTGGLADLARIEELQGTREHEHWGHLALSARSASSAMAYTLVDGGGAR